MMVKVDGVWLNLDHLLYVDVFEHVMKHYWCVRFHLIGDVVVEGESEFDTRSEAMKYLDELIHPTSPRQ